MGPKKTAKDAGTPSAKRAKVDAEAAAQAAVLEAQLFHSAEQTAADLTNGTGVLRIYEDRERAAQVRLRAPAWEDPEEAALQVSLTAKSRSKKLRAAESESVVSGDVYAERLRTQHARLNPRSSWARRRAPEREAASATAALLTRQGGLLGRSGQLAPGQLETSRLRDANAADPAQAVIQCLEYHPNGQLLLTAGLDKRLRFFAVDGGENPLIQSLFLEDMPVHCAAFCQGGTKVLATGRRKHLYVADLAAAALERVPSLFGVPDKSLESFVASSADEGDTVAFFGRDGTLPLVSLRSRQVVATLRMNGTARAGAFRGDGLELYTAGGDGTVYVWDVRQRACRARFVDEGALRGTALAASADGGLLATGSSSGVVNVYGRAQAFQTSGDADGVASPLSAAAPKPRHTAMNLTTTIDSLAFSPDAQILALASRMKRDSLRLMHVQTGSIFANWPTSRSPLGYVHSLAFSPSGGSLAIGTAKGRVLVYRLHHYPNA